MVELGTTLMAIEIERKFLVVGDGWKDITPIHYCQGYLNTEKHRSVRVRIAGDTAQLTIKGLSVGASRAEFEYAIPVDDAKQLLGLCAPSLIEKKRRRIVFDGLAWEVDEFLGDNTGLVIAEVELESEDQKISLPDWVGEEVTHDQRYFNSNLSREPFNRWH